MAKKKAVLYPVFFMVLVTVLFTSALATLNAVTAERIDRLSKLSDQRSLLYVFGLQAPEKDEDVAPVFSERIEEGTFNDLPLYTLREGEKTLAYAFEIQGAGLWGTITAHLAFDASFDTLLGVNFTSHSETPGLGGRIDEIWFKDQFRQIPLKPEAETLIFRPETGGNVDAISGATSTSKAVRRIVNEQITLLYGATEGGARLEE